MGRKRWRGFTIIEMVGIIALVLVLMLLFWPHICTSRPIARRSACLSNLKQLGLAAAMYRQDYDDTLFWNPAPGGMAGRSEAGSPGSGECAPQPESSFVVMLMPYVMNPRVFCCPSYEGHNLEGHLGYAASLAKAEGRPIFRSDLSEWDSAAWASKIGYGFNELLVASPCRPRKVSTLRRPVEEMALLADAERPWATSAGVWVCDKEGWGCYWPWDPATKLRHEEGQNFVFVDGRARFLKPVAKGDGLREGYFPAARLE